MASQHRAGQVVETRLAALAQPALARVPGIVPAVPDHVGAVARRAPHTVRPTMLADQVEALGVVEQRGQADQVGAHGTFTSVGGSSPRSTGHHRLHHTRYRNPTVKHGTAQLITPKPAMSHYWFYVHGYSRLRHLAIRWRDAISIGRYISAYHQSVN